ncbi:hypothetical protein KJ632_02465, partial [Patescibacteria group bacterium]|nr:hypothetical protein [Patescibacteria group bacterium]
LFSHGLRNKQYFIFNKEHSREEYEKYFESLQMGRVDQWKKLQEGWEKYKREKAVFRDNYQTNCENCDGNNLQNSKDLQNCFSCSGCDECVNGFQMDETVSSADNSHMGYDKCELCYNCIGCSGISNCLSCDSCWHGNDLAYCNLCFSSRDCLGCVAMRNNQYVILNKQYEREEYEKLRAKIVAEMREWGEFFPWELHPFAYNESVAIEYFEMDRDEVEGAGLKWREIEEVSSGEEVEKVLKCEVTGRQFRLTSREMAFYEKMGIPYPRRCPDQRQKDRQALANPWMMWERKCDKCGAMVKSAFEPGRSEKVYCEGCYLGEVW